MGPDPFVKEELDDDDDTFLEKLTLGLERLVTCLECDLSWHVSSERAAREEPCPYCGATEVEDADYEIVDDDEDCL